MLKPASLALLAVSGALAGAQNNLAEEIFDDTTSYSALFMHDSLTTDHGHLVDYEEEWQVWGFFACDGEPFVDDSLLYSVCRQHLVPPHGEGPNPWTSCAVGLIVPDEYPENPRYLKIAGAASVVPHGAHFDIHTAMGFVRLAYFLGKADISAYNLMLFGVHSDSQTTGVTIDSDSLRENVNGITDEEGTGSVVGCLDTGTGNLELLAAHDGMQPGEFLRARLHLGSPGQNGPPVMDLGGPQEWTQTANGFVWRRATLPFDPGLVGPLLNGQLYVQFSTTQWPNGATRGQLGLTPFALPPGSFQVERGRLLGGTVDSLKHSDDERLVVQRFVVANQAADPVRVSTEHASWIATPARMTVSVESSASTPSLRQTVLAFDFVAGQFEPVGSRTLSTTDTTAAYPLTSPARFVGPDGSVRLQVSYRPVGPVNNFQWAARVDEVTVRAYR